MIEFGSMFIFGCIEREEEAVFLVFVWYWIYFFFKILYDGRKGRCFGGSGCCIDGNDVGWF